MKKYLIVLLMLLVTLNTVGAVYSGEDFKITTVYVCYSDSYVKVTSEIPISQEEYSIDGCSLKEASFNIWVCPCNGGVRDFILKTKETTKNTYDITIQYYVQPFKVIEEDNITFFYNENIDNERVLSFNNIVIEPRPVKPEGITWPTIGEGSTMIMIVIVVVVVLIVLILVWLGFRFMFLGGGDTRTVKPKQPLITPKPRFKHMKVKPKINTPQVERDVTDEEVEEFLKTL